jgi:tryptophan-rich sensory protein
VNRDILTALAVCFVGALLEGLCAGSGVKKYLGELKWPSFSPPLWAWYTIGVVYYVVVFVCLYRVLQRPATLPFRNAALTLLLLMVALNAFWNVMFFRAKDLRATFVFSLCYSVIVIACWYCLSRVDDLAAVVLGFYAIYLVYANVWAYRLWRKRQSALTVIRA